MSQVHEAAFISPDRHDGLTSFEPADGLERVAMSGEQWPAHGAARVACIGSPLSRSTQYRYTPVNTVDDNGACVTTSDSFAGWLRTRESGGAGYEPRPTICVAAMGRSETRSLWFEPAATAA